MKKTLKKSMAIILATLMLLTAAPLAGFVGLEWPAVELGNIFIPTAQAETTGNELETSVSDNEKIIYDYCTQVMGYNVAVTVAILANVARESDFDPTYWGDNGNAYGIFQWNYRRTNLINWCSSQGLDYTDINAQLAFFRHELTGKDSYASDGYYNRVNTKLKSYPDTAQGACDAAYYFAETYEGCVSSDWSKRGVLARDIYWPKYTDTISSDDSNVVEIIDSGTCGENLTWTLDAVGTLTLSGTGDMYDFEDSSDMPWYDHQESIKQVIIENGVTSIGTNAFSYCISLTSVTIPDSVTSIGDYAFYFCESLSSVNIGDSVTSIGDEAFSMCSSLTSVTLGSDVTSIGYAVFFDCSSLTEIAVDADNEYYTSDNGVLYNKDKTTIVCYPAGKTEISFAIPDSVITIGAYAFCNCDRLMTVTIPDSVTSIEGWAFCWCDLLNTLTIGAGVTSVEFLAFGHCVSLTSVTISDGVTIIGDAMFSDCTSLTEITIPDSVTSINYSAFDGCSSLTEITLPDSIMSIGAHAFYNTAYHNDATNWEDNVLYIGKHLIEAKSNITGAYAVKDGTKTIADAAFRNCTSLTSVTIPDSVTSIGEEAFYGCSSLTDVYYVGSEEEWNSIEISNYNDPLKNANIHFNYHEHDYTAVVTAPTCTEQGYTTYTCANCGDTYVADETAATGHAYVGTVTTQPTCTADGVKTFVCSNNADHTYTEPVDKLGHTAGTAVMEDKTEATCTVDGSYNMVVYCATCGEKLSSTAYAITAPGHTPGADATCTEDQTCTICGDVLTDKLGHDYKAVVTAPTCEDGGYTTYTCATCGDSYVADETAALGHSAGAAATCTEDQTCTVCGETLTAAFGHAYVGTVTTNPTCTEVGVKTYVCSNDASHTYTEAVAATGHDYNTVVTAPTCSEKGFTTYTCATCGDSYATDYVGATGHSHKATVTKPATHTETGVRTYTCSACGDSYTESIAKTAKHTYTAEVLEEAQCRKAGKMLYICECGDSYTEKIPELGHIDVDDDSSCDRCGIKVCSCMCHQTGFMGFIWKIVKIFWQLFGMNPVCECGKAHY